MESYELFEVNLFVGVGIHSEQVPEHIVQLSFGGLVEDFNNKGS